MIRLMATDDEAGHRFFPAKSGRERVRRLLWLDDVRVDVGR